MHLLLLFISMIMISPPQGEGIFTQSMQQAHHYVDQIQSGSDTASHLWSLAALSKSSTKTNSYIADYLKQQRFNNPAFTHFRDTSLSQEQLLQLLTFETKSQQLLIALLLSIDNKQKQEELIAKFSRQVGFTVSSNINYLSLANAISNNEKLGTKLIPLNKQYFIHFLLFYEGGNYLSSEYISKFSEVWNKIGLNNIDTALERSFLRAALVRSNFSLKLHEKNLDLYPQVIDDSLLPNSTYRLNLYRALDYSVYRLGYFDKSLNISRTFTVPIAAYLGRENVRLSALKNQATNLYQIGKIEEAQDINLIVLQEAQNKGININESSLFNNLSITYWQSGEFNKYLELQFKSLEIAERNTNVSHQLSILKNLFIHYRNLKEKESALLYLNKAKDVALSSTDKQELGKVYISTGVFQRDFNKDYNKALQAFEKAESLLDKQLSNISYRHLLYEKAKLFESRQNYDLALSLFKQIEELANKKDEEASYLDALVDEARIYLLMGDMESAQEIIPKIQAGSLAQSSFIQIVKANTVLADYWSSIGESEKAYGMLHPVIEQVVPRAKASTSLESGFWNIEPEYLNAFDVMVNLLMDTGRQEEAIEVLDKLKTINDPALYQNPMVKSSLLNESELTQYQQLTNELDALRKQQLVSSGDKKTAIRRRIDQLSVQKQALDQKISQLTTRPNISLDDVQKSLTGSEIVLHITELNDWYYIGRVTNRNTEIDKIRLDSTTRSIFTNAITNLSSGNTNLKQLHQISELLKLQDLPQWISTITIVPDSYLFELPIDILPLKKPTEEYSYGETTYMVEKFNTHYVTSINDFITSATSSSTDHEYDFVGYGISSFNKNGNENLVPLPFAKSEVTNITDNLTSLNNRRAFLDEESSESAFKTSAPKAKILHLATHSQISDQDPLYSTLYMSGQSDSSDTDFPGQIFAYELFELNLDNEMIMLNSCESGSGSYLQGTGIMGISRALRYAGAKSLVLNLWSVNDMMASEFAIKFYEYLNQGKSKTEALQLTKVHFIKEKNANPHFWGPYMLIGEKSPIIEPYKETNFYFAASFMLYFVLFVAFSLFKRQSHPNQVS